MFRHTDATDNSCDSALTTVFTPGSKFKPAKRLFDPKPDYIFLKSKLKLLEDSKINRLSIRLIDQLSDLSHEELKEAGVKEKDLHLWNQVPHLTRHILFLGHHPTLSKENSGLGKLSFKGSKKTKQTFNLSVVISHISGLPGVIKGANLNNIDHAIRSKEKTDTGIFTEYWWEIQEVLANLWKSLDPKQTEYLQQENFSARIENIGGTRASKNEFGRLLTIARNSGHHALPMSWLVEHFKGTLFYNFTNNKKLYLVTPGDADSGQGKLGKWNLAV